MKIIDVTTHEPLPQGEEGELCVRGPQVMKGYLNEPAKTADTMTADGFLRTGDIAKIDEHGYVYITDRLKELIKVKGFPVRFCVAVAVAGLSWSDDSETWKNFRELTADSL